MVITNIASANNLGKCFASILIAIALVMMTSVLVTYGMKEDIVHSQECNVIVETGSSGYSLGDYENRNLISYTFSEEELGSNENIRQCLKQFINNNANADIVVAEYFLDGKYEDTSYELRGFYATNEKCYSYYINVSADDEQTKELYNLVKKEYRKQENDVLNMSVEDDLKYGSDIQGSVLKSLY